VTPPKKLLYCEGRTPALAGGAREEREEVLEDFLRVFQESFAAFVSSR